MGAVMTYGVVVAVFAAVGAWLLERASHVVRAPTRWVWAVGVAASVAAVGWTLVPAPPAEAGAIDAVAADAPARAAPVLPRVPAPPVPPLDLDPALAALWAGLSALVLAGLGRSSVRLARERGRWVAGDVDGHPVRVSDGLGPAAVGLLRPVVVVPSWVLDLPPADRALLLRHEHEHLRAGDGWLLLGGLAALVLVPWNPVIWWQVARLRAAIELDCDRRVLRRTADLSRYARLLVDTGRRTWTAHLGVAAFARPVSLLERRIRTMTDRRTPRRWRAALTGALGLAVGVAACRVDRPTAPDLVDPVLSEQSDAADAGPFVVDVRADPGVIVGTVTDPETGEPVAGAQVFIRALEQGALTNVQGRFLMVNVPVGSHLVEVEKPGVDGVSRVEVGVSQAGEAPVRIPLRASGAQAQEAVPTPDLRDRRALVASETGSLTGLVTAVDGTPLGDAQVFIRGDGFQVGALTRPDGRYLLLGIPPGTHQLQVRTADGVDLRPVEITAVRGERREVSVTARR